MIEQAMRSALLLTAGILLSAGALGQSVTLVQNNTPTMNVASEYFGSAEGQLVTLVADPSATGRHVGIELRILGASGSSALAERNKADVTFTLEGASFGSPVTSNNLKYYVSGVENGAISRAIKSGGSRGDRTVTFDLTVETAIADVEASDPRKILWFLPPPLQVTPVVLNPNALPTAQVRGVTIKASITPTRSVANPFPAGITPDSGYTDPVSGLPSLGDSPIAGQSDDSIVIRLTPALTASLGPAGSTANNRAVVDIGDRKVISEGVEVTMAGAAARKVQGLRVGTLSIVLASGAAIPRTLRTAELAVVSGNLDTSLGGTADVVVSGPFQAGDSVVLGVNQGAEGAKQFRVDQSGDRATLSVPIEGLAATPVIYVPGGTADLTPSRFNAALSLDFNLNGAADGPVGTSLGELNYQNIAVKAYAYGISRAGDAEITSFLRTTCASVTPPATVCSVFINCAGEDGARYFGELTANAPLRNGATGVYTSGDIASALGGGWSAGGGRCDLLSNGDLEVQHMIRTSGNALHNDSIVIGRTQSDNVGILRSRGPHPVGSVTLSLGPAVTPGEVRLLSTGRIYGPIDFIRALAAQLRGSTGLQPGTRFYAPPGAMSGGRQPMDHEPGCAFLERNLDVTPVNCFHLDDANPDARLADSRVLMSGDILYPNRAVYRPSDSTLLQPAASATATVLSG